MQSRDYPVKRMPLLTLIPIRIRQRITLLRGCKTVFIINRAPDFVCRLTGITSESFWVLDEIYEDTVVAVVVHETEFVVVDFPSSNEQRIELVGRETDIRDRSRIPSVRFLEIPIPGKPKMIIPFP